MLLFAFQLFQSDCRPFNRNAMSTKAIKTILDDAPELRMLTRRSRQLLNLQQHLRAALPAGIASRTVVANLSSGVLTINIDNGAAAAKIRQLVPRLLNKLRGQEAKLSAIKVLVQVTSDHKPLHKKRIFLDHKARNALLTFSSRLAMSPLRSAVLRLADRATPSENKQETPKKVNSYENQENNDSNS
jgi:hypothetical protein